MALGQSADIVLKIKADSKQAVDGIQDVQNATQGLTGKMSSLAGPAAAVGAAMAAVGAAALATSAAMFELTRNTAVYAGELLKLQRQTGLSAETLSTLQIAANQAGVSLDQVGDVIGELTLKLGEAAAGDKKAQQELAAHKITAKDTSTALEQLITTVNGKTTAEQKAAVATAVLGDEGKNLLPVISKLDGSLSSATERAKKFGQTISQDSIASADKFNTSLANLQLVAMTTGREFAFGLMPAVTQTMDDISRAMQGNQADAKNWGQSVGDALRGTVLVAGDVRAGLGSFFNWLANAFADSASEAEANARRIEEALWAMAIGAGGMYLFQRGAEERQENARRESNVVRVTGDPGTYVSANRPPRRSRPSGGGGGGGGGRRGGGGGKAEQSELDKQRNANQQELALTKQFIDEQLSENERLFAEKLRIEEDYLEEKARLNQFAIEEEIRLAQKLLEVKNLKDVDRRKIDSEILVLESQLRAQNNAQSVEQIKKAGDDARRLADSQASAQLADLREQLELGLLTQSQYARAVGDVKIAELERERAETEENSNERLVLDQKITEQILENSAAVRAAWGKEAEAYRELIRLQEERKKELELPNTLDIPTDATQEGDDPFARLKESWRELKAEMEGSVGMTNILNTLGQQFLDFAKSMANAVGQSVTAWALYGDSIGNSLKKALAAQLAHIAGVAVVNALYATALGFLRLAMWDFQGAGWAFLSAGLWAALAGVTAIGAKKIAGNTFNEATGGGGGGGGGEQGESRKGLVFTSAFGGFTNEIRD